MTERPCDCDVLCIRSKSSLCSCRQLLYVRPALHRTRLCRGVGVFRRGWVTVGEYLTGKGHRPPTSVGVGKLEWLPFRVVHVSKYLQCIIYSLAAIHASDRQTDGQNSDSNTVRCITCSHTVRTRNAAVVGKRTTAVYAKGGRNPLYKKLNVCQLSMSQNRSRSSEVTVGATSPLGLHQAAKYESL